MPTRARHAAPAVAALALLVLVGCTAPGPAEPSPSASNGAHGSSSPSAAKPSLDELRLDADGLVGPDPDHSLRIGRAVPTAAHGALATWNADACADGATQPTGKYRGAWAADYPSAAGFSGGTDTAPFQLDSSGTERGEVDWIVVLGTGIRTTEGVRVGDPVSKVTAAYRNPAGVVHLSLSDLYVIAGTVGQLVIEVTADDGSGYWQPDQLGRVFAMSTRPVGSAPVGLVATDNVPGCKA